MTAGRRCGSRIGGVGSRLWVCSGLSFSDDTSAEAEAASFRSLRHLGSWYSEKVLVEERGPIVAWRVIPADSGALGERGNLAEIAEPDSGRCGWGAWLIPVHCHLFQSGRSE